MSEMAIPAVATATCKRCRAPLSGKQTAYCSEHCRFQEWDSAHPRLEVLPTAARQSAKRESRARRIMDRLVSGQVRTHELWAIGGSGMSGRIAELREDLIRFGWGIRCTEDEDGATYELVAL